MTDKQRELLERVNSNKYLIENNFKFSFDEDIFIIRRNSENNKQESILCKLINISEVTFYNQKTSKIEVSENLIFEEVIDRTKFLLNNTRHFGFIFNSLIEDIEEFMKIKNYTYKFRWVPVLLYLNLLHIKDNNFINKEEHKPTQEELEDIFREDDVPKNFPKKINNNFKTKRDHLLKSNEEFLNRQMKNIDYTKIDNNRKKKIYNSKLAKQFNDLCRNADHLSPKLLELFKLDRDNLSIVYPFNAYKFRIRYNVGNLLFNYAFFNLVKVEKGEQKIYFENEKFNQKFVITLNDLINLPKSDLNIIYVYNTSEITKEKENI